MFEMTTQERKPERKQLTIVQRQSDLPEKLVQSGHAAKHADPDRPPGRCVRIWGWFKQAFRIQEVAKRPVKPSEAMRAGAKLRPQAYGAIYYRGRSCAIGAMLEGMGCNLEAGGKPMEAAIKASGLSQTLLSEIATMNDSGHPRECIAYWLGETGR